MAEDIKNNNFKPLELSERNVQTLFKRCLPSEEELANPNLIRNAQVLKSQYCGKESEKTLLSRQKTMENRSTILFLLGQLKYLHLGYSSIILQEGFLRYDDNFWTKVYNTLFKLYSMGIASNCLSPFVSKNDVIGSVRVEDCIPTLSPKDPNYQEWFSGYEAKVKKKTLSGQEPADD